MLLFISLQNCSNRLCCLFFKLLYDKISNFVLKYSFDCARLRIIYFALFDLVYFVFRVVCLIVWVESFVCMSFEEVVAL